MAEILEIVKKIQNRSVYKIDEDLWKKNIAIRLTNIEELINILKIRHKYLSKPNTKDVESIIKMAINRYSDKKIIYVYFADTEQIGSITIIYEKDVIERLISKGSKIILDYKDIIIE